MKTDAELLRNIYNKIAKRGSGARLSIAEKEVIKKYRVRYRKYCGRFTVIHLEYDDKKEANWSHLHEIEIPLDKLGKINLAEMITKKRQRNLNDAYMLPGYNSVCDIRDAYFNTGLNPADWKHGWPTFEDSKRASINRIYRSRFDCVQRIVYAKKERFKHCSKAERKKILRRELDKIPPLIFIAK